MNYKFIGWCKEGIHDKVWGVIYLEDPNEPRLGYGDYVKCLTFWGRRGAKLQTKLSYENYELEKLINNKLHKGYNRINKNELDRVYPEFETDLEKTAIWATLKL